MHREPVGEDDLVLLHALQIAPRVSWVAADEILDSNPQVLAQRWSKLRDSGVAWITAGPGGVHGDLTTALIEVDCMPGGRAVAIEALCKDPRVVTVEESTQGRDLMLTVMTGDLTEMTGFLTDELATFPGVATIRTYLGTAMYRDGSSWRLGALNSSQATALEVEARATRRDDSLPPKHAWPLIEALAVDGRRAAAELAEATGRNAATVRRQLPRLLRSGLLSFRCEVAQSVSGWPISCTWRFRVQPAQLDKTVDALSTLPNLRLCISTTGNANMVITVWTSELPHVTKLEQLLATKLP
ncbi:DNA-binding transcriptional regulator, Lrp family [Actinokineospora alba]|uniref:DNA-binding transcriptional regulator, Lrp family n=1 Tax=Actinokineospora alba TaxID=504798 RepID=A0A1H0L6H1_9PSEU|nr:Lrp/AsnC family transcriptional regulator [Actinokineospora alba]SDJ04249.1 DNA-binding transcriptional regulator, Lrp family [Actinokineospora alba]SDO63613.1 DNA-binding transcriptional regulator, Lrp family [Actinokineospora alba]